MPRAIKKKSTGNTSILGITGKVTMLHLLSKGASVKLLSTDKKLQWKIERNSVVIIIPKGVVGSKTSAVALSF